MIFVSCKTLISKCGDLNLTQLESHWLTPKYFIVIDGNFLSFVNENGRRRNAYSSKGIGHLLVRNFDNIQNRKLQEYLYIIGRLRSHSHNTSRKKQTKFCEGKIFPNNAEKVLDATSSSQTH